MAGTAVDTSTISANNTAMMPGHFFFIGFTSLLFLTEFGYKLWLGSLEPSLYATLQSNLSIGGDCYPSFTAM